MFELVHGDTLLGRGYESKSQREKLLAVNSLDDASFPDSKAWAKNGLLRPWIEHGICCV